ncbi:GHKL domain-containing protein [Lachnospiraceae bacterium 48-21]
MMGFYIWWLCINGCLFFAEVHFIEDFAGIRAKRFMAPYVLLGVLLTYGVMYAQSGGILRFVLHTGIILCFSVFVLKISWRLAIAPAAIIMTLFTFMEGFQTVLLRWLSGQTVKRGMAIFLQMAVSGVLVFLLAVTLKFMSKKYAGIGRQKISAYLFTLLLPCAFIVWVIRSGLGLDMWLESGLENGFFEKRPGLWAMAWLLGACAVFFIILKLLGNIIMLSMKEAEQEGMKEQVQRQRIYLAEAKKRNERYRRFQHDINNHFLVLSGLLHEKKYDEAGKYFDGLHGISDGLLVGIETGNPVADILLNPKLPINYTHNLV